MMSNWGIGASILMYHSIADNLDEAYTVSTNNFRKQIAWLYDNRFEVISLSSLIRSIQAEDKKGLRKKVVITFDDGFQDFVINALPILQEYNATATVFLVTDLLGKEADWNRLKMRLMTEDEVRHIKEQGISLGSHTATHINLKQADPEEANRQIKESLEALKGLGETFFSLAYPWGQWSEQVAGMVKDAGYECALAVGEQTRMSVDDCYQLPRITMTQDMDQNRFKSLLNRTCIEKDVRRKYRCFREKIKA